MKLFVFLSVLSMVEKLSCRGNNTLLKKTVWRQEPRIFLGDFAGRPA
jgi:hypothetical protein